MLRQIEQEIEEIETAIAKVISRVQSTYAEYSQAVAQAVQQQLVMGTYHICTRDYPHSFIALSLAERQNLQSEMQVIAKTAVASVSQTLSECKQEQQIDQDEIDRVLVDTLAKASHTMNDLLVSAKVINSSLSDDAAKVQIRLSEVEFTNRAVMAHRGELRVLSARLQQLNVELEKKNKAKVVAEAELAWRSTWIEL